MGNLPTSIFYLPGKGEHMPIYQYWNRKRGVTVELRRAVDERDQVSPGLQRITVPRRFAILGTSSTPMDPHTADAQVPKALKQLSNNQVNGMVKEGGFSVAKYKEVWGL